MLQYERFETILEMLRHQASVRVTDLVPILDASESTIRRDIAELDREGRLKKVFGGAVSIEPQSSSNGGNRRVNVQRKPISAKAKTKVDEKTRVAAFAAEKIESGDLIYIDAGTTTGSMIEHIDCMDAIYVTNGARHAIELAERGFKTYLVAGEMKSATEAVIGYGAVDSLRKYHFSKCFIGTDGVDAVNGLTTSDIEESMVKAEAIKRSEEVYILADSSKFGLVAAITFAPLDAGMIITDQLTEPEYRNSTKIIELDRLQAQQDE